MTRSSEGHPEDVDVPEIEQGEPVPSLRIDFGEAPRDPVERLVWLSGARSAFDTQVHAEWQRAYYEARLSGRFDSALRLRLHSKKRALAFTRAENESRGRAMRWNDGFSLPQPRKASTNGH